MNSAVKNSTNTTNTTNSTNSTNETSNNTTASKNTTNTANTSSTPANSTTATNSTSNTSSKSITEYAEEAIKDEVKESVKDLITGDITYSNIKVYSEDEMNSTEALKDYAAEGKIAFEVTYVVTPKDENSKNALLAGSAEEDGNKVKKHNVGTLMHSAKGSLVVQDMGTGF